jgi:hypothetical protein
LLKEEHRGDERKKREDTVAKNSKGSVEFDPWFASEASGGIWEIPWGEERGGEAEGGGKGGRKKTEKPEAACGANNKVEEDCRPGDELTDLIGVAEGAAPYNGTAKVKGEGLDKKCEPHQW